MTSTLGERAVEKAAGLESEAAVEAELRGVLFEDGADFGQIESEDSEMRMREGDLRGSIALRCAYVADGLVILEGKFCGNGHERCRG